MQANMAAVRNDPDFNKLDSILIREPTPPSSGGAPLPIYKAYVA